MLNTETIAKMAVLLKVPAADLTAAIKDEKEVAVEIQEELTVLTKTELETRDTSQKNEGIKTGKEIGAKEVRTAAGLDENAGKDPKKIADAIIAKAIGDAKIPANEKVTELTKQNELLNQKLTEKDGEIETERKKSAQVSTDRKILTAMPKNRVALFDDEEYLDIAKKSIKEVDGQLVVCGKDGEPIRDTKTTKPLDLNAGLLAVFTERKWLEKEGGGAAGGRGGKDEKGAAGVFTKKSEVIADFEKQGKSMNGEEGKEIVAKLAELAKADAGFDMNG